MKQKPTSIVQCLIYLQIRKVNFPDVFVDLYFPNGVRYKQIQVVFVGHLFHWGGSNDIRDEYIFFISKNLFSLALRETNSRITKKKLS